MNTQTRMVDVLIRLSSYRKIYWSSDFYGFDFVYCFFNDPYFFQKKQKFGTITGFEPTTGYRALNLITIA